MRVKTYNYISTIKKECDKVLDALREENAKKDEDKNLKLIDALSESNKALSTVSYVATVARGAGLTDNDLELLLQVLNKKQPEQPAKKQIKKATPKAKK